MTATNHAVTGAAIAVALNSAWALPLAFAAHFVMDAIPHFDTGQDSPTKLARDVASIDVLISILLTIVLIFLLSGKFQAWLIGASAFLCFSPDLVWGWRYLKLRDYKKVVNEPMNLFSRWHQKIQWSESILGIIPELIWLTVVLVFIVEHR